MAFTMRSGWVADSGFYETRVQCQCCGKLVSPQWVTRVLRQQGIERDGGSGAALLPTHSCESVVYQATCLSSGGWEFIQREYLPLVPGLIWKPLADDDEAAKRLDGLVESHEDIGAHSLEWDSGTRTWVLFDDRSGFKGIASRWPMYEPVPRLSGPLRAIQEGFWSVGWRPIVAQRPLDADCLPDLLKNALSRDYHLNARFAAAVEEAAAIEWAAMTRRSETHEPVEERPPHETRIIQNFVEDIVDRILANLGGDRRQQKGYVSEDRARALLDEVLPASPYLQKEAE